MNPSFRPCNNLVLMTDEQDGAVMGAAGHPYVHTPHMDALIQRGTRFSRAFTPSPICVPARASFATGRWVHEIGYWDNAMGYDGRVPGWGHILQAAGQRVESIGKLHYRRVDDPTGFDQQHQPLHLAEGVGQVWGSVRDPLPDQPKTSRLFGQLGAGWSSYNQYDTDSAELAMAWLQERAQSPDEQPWTLFVGFVAPHFPLVVPQKYIDGLKTRDIPLPRLHPSNGYVRHPWVERHAKFYDCDAELGTDERRQLALLCYYALVQFIDEQIGRVLTVLRQLGLESQTRVILTSDHGDNQGVRGMWNKSTLYRESTQVPLVISGPDVPSAHTCATAVNLVDIAPTLIQGAGVEVPTHFSGQSLLELARQPDDLQRIGFSEYHAAGSPSAAYMVHQGRWAYHHYVGYAPELFDMQVDPGQTHDLANDPAWRGVCKEMEATLRTLLDPEGTDRCAKDDQNQLVSRWGGRDAALQMGPQGASPAPVSSVT